MTPNADVDVLYKYRDLKEQNIERVKRIFLNHEVYFSRPLDFNDPFDCQPNFSLTASDQELESYLEARIPTFLPDLNRQGRRHKMKEFKKSLKERKEEIEKVIESSHRKRILEETGVFSLSEVPDHILLWSHYADSHTGICLQFEATRNTQFFGLAQKVQYQFEYPLINPIVNSPDHILNAALLTKAKFWEYEKEWRIFWMDAPPGVYEFPEGLLKGVIFGTRILQSHKDMVLSWITKMKNKPEIYQAKLKKREYGLDIE